MILRISPQRLARTGSCAQHCRCHGKGWTLALRAHISERQRRYGAEIRRLRLDADVPVQVAAAHIGIRGPQLNHIEAARTGLDEERLRSLASFYGCTDEEFLHTLAAIGASDGKGWWSRHKRKVPDFALDLAELEHWATTAYLNYETFLIPGMLQTEDYMRQLFGTGETPLSPEEIANTVRFRLERQQLLDTSTTFHFVVHEAALLMAFAGRHVMRNQLAHILAVSEKPNVTVQVFPFSVRATPPYSGPFLLTEPASRALSTVVIDTPGAPISYVHPETVNTFRGRFDALSRLALDPGSAGTSTLPNSERDSWGVIQHIKHGLELER
ncbi:helix-turn-helix transcriptional regulator [Kitasatospora purpeofusca]|uniref:Helix-turn-helix domain-containing protein n=1 Tax=Kitasatospora purpeofusca TaxID=67352 RepID=A0ABZ1U1Y3_9ACTN|nr:helix-turn-helix transcriptional regulator [Kitasatospora purpeofusca]